MSAIFLGDSNNDAEIIEEIVSYLNLYPSLADLVGDVVATLAREGA